MEKQRRVYPAKRVQSKGLSAALLVIAAMLIVSGLVSRTQTNDFSLVTRTEETPIPMNEPFDETPASLTIELPESAWYALQVGVFEGEETARQAAQAFQKRGAAGYIWLDGRHRVLASVYPSKEDAQAVREQLKDQHSIDSYLYAIEYPAVHMRLTGMQGQLEILHAAFGHVNELALQLQALSVAIDRQETAGTEAKEQLEAMSAQADIVALRLKQRFSKPIHSTVQALIDCFADYSRFASGFSGNESAAEMGMLMKYQTFVTLQKIHDVYQTLSQT